MTRTYAVIAVIAATMIVGSANLRAEDETKGSIALAVGGASVQGKFSDTSGTKIAVGFRAEIKPFYEKKNFLNRVGIEPSFTLIPIYSSLATIEGGGLLAFKERIYQPAADLGIEVLRKNRFKIDVYGGTAFSFDRFAVPGNYYTSFYTRYSACDVLPKGTCRTDFSLLGRVGTRFKYFPKEDGKFFIGGDINSRRQYLFIVGTEF